MASDASGTSDSEFSFSASSSPPPDIPSFPRLRRSPTDSSYYDFKGTPWDNQDPKSQAWMYASEARQQQAGVPASLARPYPSPFSNGECLPLSTPGSNLRPGRGIEWVHNPLIPGQEVPWTPQSGIPRGGVRAISTDGNPNQFDVGYHDSRVGTSARGHGQFALAQYHTAVPPLPPPLPPPPPRSPSLSSSPPPSTSHPPPPPPATRASQHRDRGISRERKSSSTKHRSHHSHHDNRSRSRDRERGGSRERKSSSTKHRSHHSHHDNRSRSRDRERGGSRERKSSSTKHRSHHSHHDNRSRSRDRERGGSRERKSSSTKHRSHHSHRRNRSRSPRPRRP